MSARLVIMALAFVLWGVLTGLTIYELIKHGPDILVFMSLVFVTVLGVGIFGALNERRGGPR